MANCDRMVKDRATVTMESLWETTITLSNDTRTTPSPKMGVTNAPKRMLPPGEYDRRY